MVYGEGGIPSFSGPAGQGRRNPFRSGRYYFTDNGTFSRIVPILQLFGTWLHDFSKNEGKSITFYQVLC